jgi:hypothetical protein
MLIGLGKHAGAKIYHRAIQDFSWLEIVTAVATKVLEKCNVIAGLAILENAYDETGMLAAVAPEDLLEREKELLVVAKQWMPRLPFGQIDLLVVDEIGKNISGSGMDTNVIGRKFRDHAATDKDSVRCKRIFVRGLTEETHGNSCGLGMAEFTNQRTIESVNLEATRINALTGGHPTAAALPIAFSTDRDVIDAALQTVGLAEPEDTRVVQVSNTLHVGEVLVSEAYVDEIESRTDLELVSGPDEMEFDADENLIPVAAAGAHAVLA